MQQMKCVQSWLILTLTEEQAQGSLGGRWSERCQQHEHTRMIQCLAAPALVPDQAIGQGAQHDSGWASLHGKDTSALCK